MVKVAPAPRADLRFAVTPDVVSVAEAELVARKLAQYRPSQEMAERLARKEADAKAAQQFLDFFGIKDARLWDPRKSLWGRATGKNRLRIPLGLTTSGEVRWLDLKEEAEGGMGPHGSWTGMTGSGKSEGLRTAVLELIMMHSPEELWLLLGDFKGEAAFAGLELAPHVQGLVTNLADKQYLLDRMREAIEGEMYRRQEILKHFKFMNVRDYMIARRANHKIKQDSKAYGEGLRYMKDSPNLPPLLIVIDEFSELLKMRPDQGPLYDDIGRRGRSLAVQLLIASQRTESGKMAGLIPQLGYRISGKVKDAGQSREALGESPKAFTELKSAPQGTIYLAYGDTLERFRTFFVSAPFVPPPAETKRNSADIVHPIAAQEFTSAAVPILTVEADAEDQGHAEDSEQAEEVTDDEPDVSAKTLLDVIVGRIAATGHKLEYKIWRPPLEDTPAIPFDELLAEFRGFDNAKDANWRDVMDDAGLRVPYARDDYVFGHSQEVLALDLSGPDGNVGIAGATGSGKSVTCRTLMTSMAATHSPRRVQFYAMDLGGGKLGAMAGLPHTVAVAGRGDPSKLERVLLTVEDLLARRIRSFELAGGLTIEEFRARKFGADQGEFPEDEHGDVFLFVDNVKALYDNFYELHERLSKLVGGASLNYGIHVVIANDQWGGIRPAIKDKLGSKIEHRMGSAIDSTMGNKSQAELVPEDQPGRALRPGGRHLMVAVPQASDMGSVDETVAELARVWADRGHDGRKLAMLPKTVTRAELPVAAEPVGARLRLGLGELPDGSVGLAELDLEVSPHMYVLGGNKAGRTSVLQTLAASIRETFPTREQAHIIAFETQMGLAEGLDHSQLTVYGNGVDQVQALSQSIAQRLSQTRRAPRGLTGVQLAQWRFEGPHWFILVDDVNQLNVGGPPYTALAPLLEDMPSFKRMRVHVIVTCTTDMWHTNSGNKVLTKLATAGAAVLVMDSTRDVSLANGAIRGAPRAQGCGELVQGRSRRLIQVALPPQPSVMG
ncbi:type VII secretion protein EccCb [Mycobacteroides abscessus]|uniref:type VII secretion protein EccCb n=1 Tax=Mycobacteroides abscessus TaxID=36809 RepID=UPI0009A592F2|nr:type VII secretion protein EccCb [Mycobacteroides abscessus]SKO16089.1 DNA segregation ATPase FtsK/SpoIIIE [Mycobacteroides abscessus subsp. bolletii]SKX37083.1 DNA segregation ATPase FtsK/SpoIIIE [Mycobacteroides abscessus subsp. bolletii]